MLTNKIRLTGPETFDPEDILSSSLGVIFPDDIMNQHGDSTCSVIYSSSRFGDVALSLADPQGEQNRSLFSHFLWNAGIQVAVFIEEGDDMQDGDGDGAGVEGTNGQETGARTEAARIRERRDWDVKGETVLELGAGTGLGGIIAALCGASRVAICDYPAPEVLENIRQNVSRNISASRRARHPEIPQEIEVRGHLWGSFDADSNGDDGFAAAGRESFSRIIVADCLWMPWQHANLLRSIRWFLTRDGRAWIVAGFHSGRAKMRGFFEEGLLREAGLALEAIWERDAEGKEREWALDRGFEDSSKKRWLVVGILKRVD